MKPQPIPNDFVWRSHLYHLTYRGKMTPECAKVLVARATSIPLAGWSLAQEDTSYVDEQGNTIEGYVHTHLALIFKARLNLQGARKFDWHTWNNGYPDVIHPHVQPKVNMIQMEQIFIHYHAGRKFCLRKNCMVFEPPLLHEYMLPPDFEWTHAVLEEVVNAPSLFSACIAGQVRPRSVSDVKQIRDEVATNSRKTFIHKYKPSDFVLKPPPEITTLHVWGGSGLGKTKWCLALFRNPCYIKPFNSIGCLEELGRKYDAEMHDGIIFDEVDLHFLTREKAIALVDFEEESCIDVRYKSYTIPAGVPKILISNPSPAETYPNDPFGAISRRVTPLHIEHKTWQAGNIVMENFMSPTVSPTATQPTVPPRAPLCNIPPTATNEAALARVPTPMAHWRAATGR